MKKPIWFPFYPGDFLTSNRVALMTTEEIGGYILLLCYEWQDPTCTLPADDDSLRKLSKLTGSLETVKSCFIQKRGRLLNERLYEEWKKVKEKSELAKHSIAVRWQNERNTNVQRSKYSSHRNIGTEEHRNRRTKEQENKRTEEELEKKKELNTCAQPSVVAEVWSYYTDAYRKRYQTDPVRNAKVNAQLSQFCKRVPAESAPAIAAFYVRHNDAYYVRARHPPGLLLRDAEGLHTQWITGQTVTSSQARQVDATQGRLNVFQELINERNKGVIDVETT